MLIRRAYHAARIRLAVGLAFAASLPLWLPERPDVRAWTLAALTALLPWMVLGRDAGRRAAGLRQATMLAPRCGRLVLVELLPALTVLLVGAVAGSAGRPSAVVALVALGAGPLALADALDRRGAHLGAAWVAVLSVGVLVWTAPLWLAPAFGAAPWSPWLATLAVGLHPAAVSLAAHGLPTLQDPLFYGLTLSGVVEVRPLPWTWGAAAAAALAGIGTLAARHAAARPPRRAWGA